MGGIATSLEVKSTDPPVQNVVAPLGVIVGIAGNGFIVSVSAETAGKQSPIPSGSSVVNEIITDPAVISAAEGVYEVAVPKTALGLKVPVPLVLHCAEDALPPMEPPKV